MIIERFHKLTDDVVRSYQGQTCGWNMLPAVTPAYINRMYRMYAAIKGLTMDNHHNALTIKCQYELSRTFGMAPCMPLAILGDETVVSCEGELPLVVTQLILHYLTGTPTSYEIYIM